MKMGTNYLAILGVTTVTTVMSCTTAKKEYMSYELYPVRTGSLIEMEYTPEATKFTLWSRFYLILAKQRALFCPQF